MDWQRLPASRWGLRQLGALCLIGAYSATRHLVALAANHAGDPPPPRAYLLGLIAFVCGSAGCALLVHGHHLFDPVDVADRWKPRPRTPDEPPDDHAI